MLEVPALAPVRLLRAEHVAVGHATPQGLGRHVHQLDLVGATEEVVGDGVGLALAGDLGGDVAQRLHLVDVHGGDHVDAEVEQHDDLLPALGVHAAGRVGVGDVVDDHDRRSSPHRRLEVELPHDVTRRDGHLGGGRPPRVRR